MLRRITLENFMSHAHTVIDLGEGLTVLVGPNNCGKSAVVEALRTVCTNMPAEMLVRHGEREARITVETDDGHTVVWRRKGSAVSYVIDGREIHRLKGGVPDDLHEVLRLPKVTTPQGDTFDIHFALQKSPMFLIDETGSKAAGFFSTSSDAEKLMEMQRRHREKVRNAKARQKDVGREVERLAGQLEALSPVGMVAEAVDEAERAHAAITEGNQQIGAMGGMLRQMEALRARREAHAEQCAILGEMQAVPVMEETGPLEGLITRLEVMQHAVEREQVMGEAMGELRPVPVMEETGPLQMMVDHLDRAQRAVGYFGERLEAVGALERLPELEDEGTLGALCDRLEAARRQVERVSAVTEALTELRDAPAIADVSALQGCIEALEKGWRGYRAAAERHASLGRLESVPELADVTGLEGLIERWTENRRLAAQHAVDVFEIDAQLAEIEKQIRAWAAAHPKCPVCGSAVDPDRILGEEHAHA